MQTAHMPHQANSCADLPACCSFRHGLHRATFLREEGFGFPRSLNLSLPLGEMSRSDREGRNQLTWLFKFALIRICQCAALSVICWRKCQLSQRESREAGADCTHAASGELLRRPARVLLLPSRLAPCHLPQGGRLWVSAQPKLVSPLGRDVAQRQRWLILLHASGCLAVSPTSQNTVRNTAAMSAESVMPL